MEMEGCQPSGKMWQKCGKKCGKNLHQFFVCNLNQPFLIFSQLASKTECVEKKNLNNSRQQQRQRWQRWQRWRRRQRQRQHLQLFWVSRFSNINFLFVGCSTPLSICRIGSGPKSIFRNRSFCGEGSISIIVPWR